jgi:hypothetical protein
MIRMIERAGGGLFECGSCDARFVFERFAGDDRIDEPAFCPVYSLGSFRRWQRLIQKPAAGRSRGCLNRAACDCSAR